MAPPFLKNSGRVDVTMSNSRMSLTLDSNVFVAAIKEDEPFSEECREVLRVADGVYTLYEPSVVFAEVLGTLGRRVGRGVVKQVLSVRLS